MEEASLEELERLAERHPADRAALERLDAACRTRGWTLYDRPLAAWVEDLKGASDRRWGADDPEIVLGQAGLRAVLRLIEAFWRDPEARPAAARILGRRGPGTVGYLELERALRSPDPLVRAAAAGGLGECDAEAPVPHLVRRIADLDPDVRLAAVDALDALGPKAMAAVPPLLQCLNDDELGLSAAFALGYLGRADESIVSALVDAAEGRLPGREPWALLALGLTRSRAALPTLLQALRHYDEDVRAKAADALGELEVRDQGVLEALGDHLDDWDPSVRAMAAMALARLGDGSPGVCAGLARAIEEDVWTHSVLKALARLGRKAGIALDAVLRATRRGRAIDRAEALATLAAIGPRGRAARRIAASVRDPDPTVRAGAARAVAILHPRSPEALAALVGMLDDPERRVELAAARALSTMGPTDPTTRCALIGRVSSADPGTRLAAVEILGAIGIDVDWLIAVASDVSEPVRFTALYWLAEIRETSGRAVRGLREGLLDTSARVRREGAWGLGELGAVAAPAADRLAQALGRDEDASVREHAGYALGEIGIASPGIVEALRRALGDARRNVSLVAARSLWILGVERDLARARIEESLRGEDEFGTFAARVAGDLGVAGPSSPGGPAPRRHGRGHDG